MKKNNEAVGAEDTFWKQLDVRCLEVSRVDETTAEDVRGIDMLMLVIVFVGLPILIAVLTAISA